MFTFSFEPATIAALVGTIFTLFFSYFPKVRVWFASLATETASLYKLGIMLATEVVVVLLSLYHVIQTVPPLEYGPNFWFVVISVAGALLLTGQPLQDKLPNPRDVRVAIQKRMARAKLNN